MLVFGVWVGGASHGPHGNARILNWISVRVHRLLTDEKSKNPAWKAIGYNVNRLQKKAYPKWRPLQKGIIKTMQEDDSTFVQSLTEKGLEVMEDPEHSVYKIKCDVVISWFWLWWRGCCSSSCKLWPEGGCY
ncbi:hypothetical protein REPUB_Repub12eG0098900 [Reevesia pubescens]